MSCRFPIRCGLNVEAESTEINGIDVGMGCDDETRV